MARDDTLSEEPVTKHPAAAPSRVGSLTRWFWRGMGVFGLVVLLTFLLVISPVTDRVYFGMDCQDELRPADWIICLGGDAGRTIESARLLQEGYAPKLIVTSKGAAADRLAQQAIDWGADPQNVLIEDRSTRTVDHPDFVAKLAGIDRSQDTCILVTSYTHMKRARQIFEDAGYRHLIVREMRWEREARSTESLNWRIRLLVAPQIFYEAAGWCRYRLFG